MTGSQKMAGPKILPILIFTIALAMASGCGLVEDVVDPDPPGPGHTECGDFPSENVFCQPGQYCEDPTFSECREGCLSNENCADDQRCVKTDDTNIGTCQNAKIRDPEETSGITPCGTSFNEKQYCQPGQYCENASFNSCETGCLSDANCLGNQACQFSDDNDVGLCR